jgi:hypothetical protein
MLSNPLFVDRCVRMIVRLTGRTLITSVALAFGLSHVLAGSQQRPQPGRSGQGADTPITMPMELLANRPIVRMKIGEQGPFALLVSPEAQATVIDRTLSTELKLRPQSGGIASPPDVEIELGPSKVRVTVADLARLLPDFSPAVRPRGILSASAWPNRLVTIDYPRWQVIIESGSLPEPNRRDVFALKPESPELGPMLVVGGRTMPCQLDPLFPGGFLIPESQVKLLPTVGRTTDVGSMTITNGSVFVREVELATEATLGMFEFPTPLVQFGDTGEACRIGGQRLNGCAITYDLANARVRLVRRPT